MGYRLGTLKKIGAMPQMTELVEIEPLRSINQLEAESLIKPARQTVFFSKATNTPPLSLTTTSSGSLLFSVPSTPPLAPPSDANSGAAGAATSFQPDFRKRLPPTYSAKEEVELEMAPRAKEDSRTNGKNGIPSPPPKKPPPPPDEIKKTGWEQFVDILKKRWYLFAGGVVIIGGVAYYYKTKRPALPATQRVVVVGET